MIYVLISFISKPKDFISFVPACGRQVYHSTIRAEYDK